MLRASTAVLLTLALVTPLQQAAAQNPLGGAIVGGAAGALLGGAVGGGRGAAAGAIIGGVTGAAIAAQGRPYPGGYYYYNNSCYIRRADGAWLLVDPRSCAGPPVYVAPPVAVAPPPPEYDVPPGYAPPPPGYAPPPPVAANSVAACAQRYRSYDPTTQTFLGFDGQRHPCP
jgi:hypothetical protein